MWSRSLRLQSDVRWYMNTLVYEHAGFWGCRHHRSFFDVRVFNDLADSNQSSSLAATFRKHEGVKRRAYEERVREVERGSFTPLVFSSSGGMGKLLL